MRTQALQNTAPSSDRPLQCVMSRQHNGLDWQQLYTNPGFQLMVLIVHAEAKSNISTISSVTEDRVIGQEDLAQSS